MKKTILTSLITFAGAFAALAQVPAGLTQLGPLVDQDTTLEAGSQWYIEGVTYVTPGTTLTIEPGVTIYADDEDAALASTLIVTEGATINAVGTPDAPIVFTSVQELDFELDHSDVSLWAGIIVLGDATINADSTDIPSGDGVVLTNLIEGITPTGRHGLSVSEEGNFLTYGGSDDADSSGIIKYVSIRHTGISLTGESGDEIQGLTLGGVGSGTTLENIEIFVSGDDGIEIFGGTADLKNIVLAYAEDDSLDLDQGYRGRVQNLVVIQSSFTDFSGNRSGDKGGEWDGADSPEDNTPRAGAVVANATFVSNDIGSGTALRIRNGMAAQVWNSLFLDYETWIRLDNNTANNIVETAVANGDTAFVGNIFYNGSAAAFADGTTIDVNDFSTVDPIALISASTALNSIIDPSVSITRESDGKVILSAPASGSAAYNSANAGTLPDDGFFTDTEYVGAFAENDSWAAWTFAATNGYIAVSGWVATETLGWVYTYTGSIAAGEFVFVDQLNKFAYIYGSVEGQMIVGVFN